MERRREEEKSSCVVFVVAEEKQRRQAPVIFAVCQWIVLKLIVVELASSRILYNGPNFEKSDVVFK